jgi:hypothetical protein
MSYAKEKCTIIALTMGWTKEFGILLLAKSHRTFILSGARALFYWVILKNNYWLFQYTTLSTYIKKAPRQYGESFLMVESDGFDLTYFIPTMV